MQRTAKNGMNDWTISPLNSYRDAVATIRRTSVPFQYQLVITRAYEEGEEQLLEEDAECTFMLSSLLVHLLTYESTSAEDERVFLLDQGLSFRSGILDGDVTFAWRDLSGDPGDMWEFVVNSKSVPKATSGVFEMTVLQCMYERVSNGCVLLPDTLFKLSGHRLSEIPEEP